MKPYLIIIILLFNACHGTKKFVTYGKNPLITNNEAEIFVDREGLIYPMVEIAKSKILSNSSKLANLPR